MSTGSIDIEAKSRKYTQSYALNTAKGVAALLRDRHRIAERRYRGDTAASDIIIDLHSAIESAGLTERQAESIAWVYGRDLTQEMTAQIIGVTRQAVKQSVDSAIERISAIFQRWDYGEVTVEVTATESEDETIVIA
ncbi:RNA polymerase subunit sigma [Paenibacillus sp. HWE-109]|uniref:sigma factor-like helix-turn-helix DNA-binding protein n=1 Tax=Paenibacillus sp. HWE-109 TaxID=1306526 RepID=UPI001EDE4FD5|nr:sigma factor-like helix-turn-helix DNA-binding protein [Paenibacillus sp. HWE-109]UKS30181.1 RNA polymerase subunit sigma [Paenibacillus sp. HWE-109]